MNFQDRFKGRMSTMSKEGIAGVIKMTGNPIEKDYSAYNDTSTKAYSKVQKD